MEQIIKPFKKEPGAQESKLGISKIIWARLFKTNDVVS